MELTSHFNAPGLQLTLTGPTVVAPGEDVVIKLMITALKNCSIGTLMFILPDAVFSDTNPIDIGQNLEEGQALEKEFLFTTKPGSEGSGEIEFILHYALGGSETTTTEFANWISVFKREIADGSELSDPLRERLVKVVNSRSRNGHIFLADFVSFFDDFLNIEIPGRIAEILAQEFAFEEEGLPVDQEKYISVINGEFSFYGIEQLELIYEEECNESDDKFDMSAAAEVNNPLV
jgi:hypothetical protein